MCARHLQGPAHPVELALVVDGAGRRHRAAILETARLMQEIVVRRLSQSFLTTSTNSSAQGIAIRLLRKLREAEIGGGVFIVGRHHIPSGAAAADMIERGILTGHIVQLAKCRRGRAHQSDPFGDGGDGGKDHQRIEHRLPPPAAIKAHRIGQEEAVE